MYNKNRTLDFKWVTKLGPSWEASITPEPPHVLFCVYLAILVLWYGMVAQYQDRLLRNMRAFEAGAKILFHLKVHVAKHLGDALYELMVGHE